MNKICLNIAIVFTTFMIGSLQANYDSTLEVRSSAYFPNSHQVREVYGQAHPTFGIEASQTFCNCLNFWVDIDYFSWSKNQKPCCKSKIEVLNSSFGLRTFYPLCNNIEAYLGLGVSFSGVDLKNSSCCQSKHDKKFAVGGVLKSGILYTFCDPFYLNFFADYLYQPMNYKGHLDIGGIKVGLGLGVGF